MADPQPNPPAQVAESQNDERAAFSLANILSDTHDTIEHPTLTGDVASTPAEGWDEEDTERLPVEGYCVECEGAGNSAYLASIHS